MLQVEDVVNLFTMNNKEHWENVFANKQQTEVSWYQPTPLESIEYFESQNVPKSANIIDIGCGDSYFIDYLVNENYENIYALDISENAITRLKKRLGEKANKVNWIVSDIRNFKPELKFDYWHDRAVFHFLKDKPDVLEYVSLVNNALNENGRMMIATFSESGPLKCSGLDICRYNSAELAAVFSKQFKVIDSKAVIHKTPFDTTQNFIFNLFARV